MPSWGPSLKAIEEIEGIHMDNPKEEEVMLHAVTITDADYEIVD